MISLGVVLLVLALVCFLIAAFGAAWPSPRVNMIALGLFFWVLSILVGGHGFVR
jgi:hypothetical protein